MKKISMILLAIVIAAGIYILEGGRLGVLLVITSFIPIFIGSLVTTSFTFTGQEISDAFTDAFSSRLDMNRTANYQMSLQVIKHLEASVLLWAATVISLALIGILSSLTEVSRLGPSVAATISALLYGFGLRTIVLTPMRFSIIRKLTLAGYSAD